jgi:hypothetical protein
MHAVLDRRGARNAKRLREVVRQPLHDDGVAAEWKMRSVLFGRPHGHDERGALQ